MLTIRSNDVLVQNVKRFLHIKEENIYIYQKMSKKWLTIMLFCAIIITRNNVTHKKNKVLPDT